MEERNIVRELEREIRGIRSDISRANACLLHKIAVRLERKGYANHEIAAYIGCIRLFKSVDYIDTYIEQLIDDHTELWQTARN